MLLGIGSTALRMALRPVFLAALLGALLLNGPPAPAGAQTQSSDASVSAITVDGAQVRGDFGSGSGQRLYGFGVPSGTDQVTVAVSVRHSAATFSFTAADADATTDGHQVDLDNGQNSVGFTVTAEDGSTMVTYELRVSRSVTATFGWNAANDFYGLRALSSTKDTSEPKGLWSDGTTIWVATGLQERVHAFLFSTRAFTTSVNTRGRYPRGIWSDGTTIWIADWIDDKLYAIRLADDVSQSSLEFNTLRQAGNLNPTGIWSDGETMWVADSQDDKL